MPAPAPIPVPCRWPGGLLICVAPGPSLTPDDLADVYATRTPTLAVNDGIFSAPFADVLYAADTKWWQWHADDVRSLSCWRYAARPEAAAIDPAIGILRIRHTDVFSPDPGVVAVGGGHGGWQAINVACHLVGPGGVIALLGYDMMPLVTADGTVRHHARQEHPDGSHPRYDKWIRFYAQAYTSCRARSIRLLNASRRTAITVLPRVDLAAVLAGEIPA